MDNSKQEKNVPLEVSRRDFLVGSSVGAMALASMGLFGCGSPKAQAPAAQKGGSSQPTSAGTPQNAADAKGEVVNDIQHAISQKPESTEENECDVVVIGTGISGMSAAVTAATEGAKVIVYDKMPNTGGDSSICSGNYYVSGSQFQKDHGYGDFGTPEEVAQFFYEKSQGDANYDYCKLVADNAASGMDWLVSLGADFKKKEEPGATDKSMISKTGGKGLVDVLVKAAEAKGAQVVLKTRVVDIVMEGGKVAGVVARQGTKEIKTKCKAVVVASGGYDGQQWSKARYAPGSVGHHSFSSGGNVGDGIELGRKLGARITLKNGLSGIHLVGKEPLMLNDPLSQLRMINTGVFVSDIGYRCANESMTSPFQYYNPMVHTGRQHFFIICDSNQDEKRLDLLKKGVEQKVVNVADTLEQLAVEAGIPPYPLKKTIDQYHSYVEKGADPEFGKKPEDLVKLEKAPFYAVQITPNTNDTFGGFNIDLETHALDKDNKPIHGLYAVGSIATPDLFYLVYPISGSSLAMGTVTGRIAGANAVKECVKA